jgi:plastocyanin
MTTKERAAHANSQTFGLVLVSAALLVAVLLTLILFDGDDIAFILVPTVAAVGAAIVTWRFDSQWARAIGIIGTVLSLGAFFLAFGLFHLFSPIEFIVALTYVLGFFMSLVGAVRALLAGRKGEQVPADSGRRFHTTVLAVIGVAAVVSVTGFLLTKESVDDSEAAGATALEMVKFEFNPGSSALPVDGKLLIQNNDPFVHDFTFEAMDIAVTIGPGSQALVDMKGTPAGTYDYICSLHTDGDSGMTGTITITG